MYTTFRCFTVFNCTFLALFCLVSYLHAFEFHNISDDQITSINIFIDSKLNEAKTIDQQIEAIFDIINIFKSFGLNLQNQPETFTFVRSILDENNIIISETMFDNLKSYLLFKDEHLNYSLYKNSRHPSYPTKPQPEYNKSTLLGFVQLFAGALLCIIPHPITQGIGGSLVASGIYTFVSDAAEKGYSNSQIRDSKEFPIGGKGPLPYTGRGKRSKS